MGNKGSFKPPFKSDSTKTNMAADEKLRQEKSDFEFAQALQQSINVHDEGNDSSIMELNQSDSSHVPEKKDSSIIIVENNDLEQKDDDRIERKNQSEFTKTKNIFRRALKRRMTADAIPSISSIEIIKSHINEVAYSRQKEAFQMKTIPTNELFVYHKGKISKEDKIDVIHKNLRVENCSGHIFGRGIYFSEYPDIEIGNSESGLLLCKVMPGNENIDKSYRLIQEGYQSKRVLASEGQEETLIIENSSQILPYCWIHLVGKSVAVSKHADLPYKYDVMQPTDFSIGPLEDESKVPHILTVYAANIPTTSNEPESTEEEEEPLCGSTSGNVPNIIHVRTTPVSEVLNNDDVAQRMRSMFETSLALQETGELMMPADAINTQLFKHQMYALAWMSNRENSETVPGGILADDMGLGKTLTVLALIISNFHDKRPLVKPDRTGTFSRFANQSASVMRYMPGAEKSFKRPSKVTNRNFIRHNAEVGAKLHNGEKRTTMKSQNQIGRRKDNKQQVKSSKYSAPRISNNSSSKLPHKQSAFDLLPSPETSEDEKENDEFDSMCFSSTFSLSERLLGSDEKSTQSLMIKPEKHFHDGLSDDEEYQNMSEAERNEHFKPKLEAKDLHNTTLDKNINLDGMIKNISSSSEDEDFVSTTTYKNRKRGRKISSDEDESTLNIASKKATISLSLDDLNELPDVEKRTILNDISPSKINGDSIMNGRPDNEGTNEAEKKKSRKSISTLDLTEDQRKKLIIPPREPAKLQNRRRATLVVTPASLLGHWLTQIHQHVDDSVNLKVAVHYGQCKALLGTELEDNDIVLTTYGTVGAEYRSYDSGPLLRAKWLRVVLDEGHFIKNHNSQTAKACYELNTRRKWIVSGTPIQNNLTELWALLKWLNVEPYATHRPLYKRQIEHAVKHGHPHGLQRLQTLMQLICLRRTKSDQINGKPIVQLPKKTVLTKELDFTEEERLVYKSFESKGREIILRYQRKGTLLQNYAHVFAVMMRLRQLCCHKELLPIDWKDVNMQELEEQVRKEMEAEENSAGQMTGNDNSETQNRSIQLAEQLRDMIKEGLSDECSICLSEMTQPVITPCAHVYCRGCITPYIERSENNSAAQCPLCRGSLTKNGLLEAAYSDEDEEHCIGQKDPFEDITIDISSSKINEVLRQLEIAKKKGKGEKIIIVSQFTKLLSVIQPLLDEKGYHWTRLDGSMSVQVKDNVISHFQDGSPDSPQVLLLSLRAGGVGLNLTAARKLILLDPAWNPATEEQCFDRIHRLGQTEDVEIIRLIMKDSIEQRMLDIQAKKKDLISGAFRQTTGEMRQQRIQDILSIFGL